MTLTEQIIPVDRIEVLQGGSIQVREATVILRDGVHDPSMPPRYHRYVLMPGDDLKDKDPQIVAVAKAVWTPAGIEKRETFGPVKSEIARLSRQVVDLQAIADRLEGERNFAVAERDAVRKELNAAVAQLERVNGVKDSAPPGK